MESSKKLYQKLPKTPGVYLMKNASGKILYVGKAGNLWRRVSSYFLRPQEIRIQKLVEEVRRVDYEKTDTAIEALILEANLIKKLLPPFNVRDKDDKSFLYVAVTKDEFPRVLLVRGKERGGGHYRNLYGPFTSASSLKEALRIIRRIFPYNTHILETKIRKIPRGTDEDLAVSPSEAVFGRECFDYQIGLCPGVCAGKISRAEYLRTVRNIELFFSGKKRQMLSSLRREMAGAAKKEEYELAETLKRKIFALEHIQDIALITENTHVFEETGGREKRRIEGYDISNISGTSATGSMVVFLGKEPAKSEYRKFKIKTITGANDVGMLREVLRRRFMRTAEGNWPLPYLVLVDGGLPQVRAAREILDEFALHIPVVGIAKGKGRKRNDIMGTLPPGVEKKTIIRVRDEAHRFAVGYHKKLRSGAMLE